MFNPLPYKEIFGLTALTLTFVAFYPYVRSTLTGETKPHVFSWLIWGVGTVVVFLAQLSDNGGYGAWVIGLSGFITLLVAMTAWFKNGDCSIVAIDWLFLTIASTALPLWLFTEDPLSAVVVLTTVDLLGFAPSVRKAYERPDEENSTFFAIGALRNIFVLLALDNYSWTTMLFPASVGLACILFLAFILLRRSQLSLPS